MPIIKRDHGDKQWHWPSFVFGCILTLIGSQVLSSSMMMTASTVTSEIATAKPATTATGTSTAAAAAATAATYYSPHHYLEKLTYKYGSDKSHDDHGYTDFYQMMFDPIRLSIRNMTEVGVSAGQSLQAWYHYFPNAAIHGYDVMTPVTVKRIVAQLHDRVTFTQLDLLKPSLNLETDVGLVPESMDLVVEDAQHDPKQQDAFLGRLFHLVKPGGLYVMEDIHYTNSLARHFHDGPEHLSPAVQKILHENDALFIDTHIGHRDWKEWLARTKSTGAARDHVYHNSYLLVIRKRYEPPRVPVQMNLRLKAMQSGAVILDENLQDPLGMTTN